MRHINHKTSVTYKSFFLLCCKWTSEDGNLIAIKLHASERHFHDLQYTCPSSKSLRLKSKAINIMFNQLNVKKHQAFGARKTEACPPLRALEKRCSICNFLETTWARASKGTWAQLKWHLPAVSGVVQWWSTVQFHIPSRKKGTLLSLILP